MPRCGAGVRKLFVHKLRSYFVFSIVLHLVLAFWITIDGPHIERDIADDMLKIGYKIMDRCPATSTG